MSKKITYTFSRLNELSAEILSELEKESPSLETIREDMQAREEFLGLLGALQMNKEEITLTVEEHKIVSTLKDSFIKMNDEIHKQIALLIDSQRSLLAKASKQRKVQQSYGTVKTPNISYF